MIFDSTADLFESYKERNVYYKIFAGYLLNELVPGHADRLRRLCSVLSTPTGPAMPQLLRFNSIPGSRTQASTTTSSN